ncbi:MAG: hypothetical protein KC613_04670, partial [Myxococcales bacterium]|nr:hypothetical protein [Myxococcales bacterium]
LNGADNCPNVPNADQANGDGDAFGDVCDPDNVDTDNDGINDGVELACGLDPNDPNDVALDYDHDGQLNGAECQAGTNLLPVVYLTEFDTGNAGTIGVVINLDQDVVAEQPQVAEFILDFDDNALDFVDGAAGQAAINAAKDLGAALLEPGRLRVTLVGLNLNRMASGELGRLTFSVAQAGATTFTFDVGASSVAPAAADTALTFGAGHPDQPFTIGQ